MTLRSCPTSECTPNVVSDVFDLLVDFEPGFAFAFVFTFAIANTSR
jgi:hypothetical protein